MNNFKDGGALPQDLSQPSQECWSAACCAAEARAVTAGARFDVARSRPRPLQSPRCRIAASAGHTCEHGHRERCPAPRFGRACAYESTVLVAA